MSGTLSSHSSLYENMDFGIKTLENREWAKGENVCKL
jgi:hypothetical protein